MAFIFSRLSATDPVVANTASSPLTGVAALTAAIMADEEDRERAVAGSLKRRTSSSVLSEEFSKSDILSLDSLRCDSLSSS